MKKAFFLLGLASAVAACDPDARDLGTSPSASLTSTADKVVLVGFQSTPGAAETALIQGLGGQVRQRYKYIPAVSASIPAGQQDVLAAAPGVSYVEDNITMVPLGTRQTTDYGVS